MSAVCFILLSANCFTSAQRKGPLKALSVREEDRREGTTATEVKQSNQLKKKTGSAVKRKLSRKI